jgi:hypothetical protein
MCGRCSRKCSGRWSTSTTRAPREAAYARIRKAVTLLYPEGRPVPELLLHVDGGDAWWRWTDEPFT